MTDDLVVRLRREDPLGHELLATTTLRSETADVIERLTGLAGSYHAERCITVVLERQIEQLTAENGALGNQMSGMSDELLDQEQQIERLRAEDEAQTHIELDLRREVERLTALVNDAAPIIRYVLDDGALNDPEASAWLARWSGESGVTDSPESAISDGTLGEQP